MLQIDLGFLLVLFIKGFQVISTDAGFTKTWAVDFNEDARNAWVWDKNLCPNDRLIVPNNSVIYLSKPYFGRPMVLPLNGEIILGSDAQISSGNTINHMKNCKGQDRIFHLEEREWLDPGNWKTELFGSSIDGRSSANPIPHSDRVPCRGDKVVFPDKSTFKVRISLPQESVITSIRLDNVDLNDEGFRRFLSTKTGQLTFSHSDGRLSIRAEDDGSCDDQCPCQADRSRLMKKVCSFIRCTKLACEQPIQPPGHCCPLCAVMVKVAPKAELSFSDFNRVFTSYIKDRSGEGTIGYGYSVEDKSMLAVFTNIRDSSFEKSFDHAKNFMDYLYYDYQFRHALIEIFPSPGNSFLSKILAAVLVLAIVWSIYYAVNYVRHNEIRINWPSYRNRFIPNSQFTFIRFRGLEEADKASMELETATDIVASVSIVPKDPLQTKKESTTLSSIPEEHFNVRNVQDESKKETTSGSYYHDDSMDTISLEKLVK